MCSIFGFVSRGVSRPDLSTLAKIVQGNVCRGPDAFGLAWLDRRGRLHAYKQQGRLTDHLGVLALARDARMLVGHLRFATHGEPESNINNHPHPCDGGWIVHNGVVRNYDELVRGRRLWTNSECDSEAIALLVEESDASGLARRCIDAVGQTQGSLAMMGLWKPGTLVAVRRGNPLHLADGADGTYLATLAGGLPGKPRQLADDSAVVITRDDTKRTVRNLTFTQDVARGVLF